MKNTILVIQSLLLMSIMWGGSTVSLRAQSAPEYKIIHSIPAPCNDTRDLAFDGKYLWTGSSWKYQLYKISPEDGKILKIIHTNVAKPYGLTFDGKYLWVTDNLSHTIQQVDTADGTVIRSFPTPADANKSYPYGLAWDGEKLWHNDTKDPHIEVQGDSTFCLDTLGNIVTAYSAHGGYPTGLAFDGECLWCSDNEYDVIHRIDVSTFKVVQTIKAPGGDYPNGLTWDGKYLWVSNNDVDSIYQLDVSTETNISVSKSFLNSFALEHNYPNPFNPSTTIEYQLKTSASVRLTVYNLLGQKVRTLVNTRQIAGRHQAVWDGCDESGRPVSSGVYYYRLQAGAKMQTKKMMLLR